MIMISSKIVLLLSLCCYVSYSCSCSIVFVHIGKSLPEYLMDAIKQARLFNESSMLVLLANDQAITNEFRQKLAEYTTTIIELETIQKTEEHEEFLQKSTLNRQWLDGFWLYTSERFLFLYDFMRQYNLSDIIHLETDNMVYVDFTELLPIFKKYYPGIGAIFDNDQRCIPGLVYIANWQIARNLAQCFVQNASSGKNDMEVIGLFFQQRSELNEVHALPIIMPSYVESFGLHSKSGHRTTHPERYCNHIEEFRSIFDGAAIGQYLGGTAPCHGPSVPGFINESCLFDPSLLKFEWKIDYKGRNVPYILFKSEFYKINNLHIHSKNLRNFSSL